MRYYLLLFCFFRVFTSLAQDDPEHISLYKNNSGPRKEKYFSIGINPFSLAESQMSIGPCVSYRFSQRIEIWAEAGIIFHNSYMKREWENMSGFRFILQPRYYLTQKSKYFISPEFRLKHYRFDNKLDFINDQLADTLRDFPFREAQTLVGGAIVIGRQYKMTRTKNLFLEVTVGVGGKQRYIKRKVPDGYVFDAENYSDVIIGPSYEFDRMGSVYFPIGVRLIKKL